MNLVLAWAISELHSHCIALNQFDALDHLTEMMKPEPEFRKKIDRCDNPRKNRLSSEDKIRRIAICLVSSSSDSPQQKIYPLLSTIEVLRRHSYPHS